MPLGAIIWALQSFLLADVFLANAYYHTKSDYLGIWTNIPLHAVLAHLLAVLGFCRYLHELSRLSVTRNLCSYAQNVMRSIVYTATLEFALIIDHLAFHNLSCCYKNVVWSIIGSASWVMFHWLTKMGDYEDRIIVYCSTTTASHTECHDVDWALISLRDVMRLLWWSANWLGLLYLASQFMQLKSNTTWASNIQIITLAMSV